ncbi:threonine synthase [Paenibacillus thalictri]|uniref:Threonine synthase n=1 Tax=Paenibacillus thalictri TaxID=2527873 RepID=A0A4Q9DPF0_9BACL|nr:threonine synthase [Paenibacillus thalictri]TBL76011.1 threonine synthase [Paenibacillus thalictri]
MTWSYATHYTCDGCSKVYELNVPINTCPDCGGLLETHYDLDTMKQELSPRQFAGRTTSMWRWHEFYPLRDEAHMVSLGEGGTPLIPSVYAGKKLGLSRLYFKNDALMPTGSFKDRGFSLAISFAKELGLTRGLTYSSGNAGASFAAYSRRAGFEPTVLVEYLANPLKKAIISLYGAKTATLYFDSMTEITDMLEQAVKRLGLYQFVNFINPVRHEAMKAYAYEISETLGWKAPDVMVHPIGTGGGIWGAWKGFCELAQLGWIDAVPRMVGVQPEATGPIVRAFNQGLKQAERHGDATKTIAQSIAADAPIQGGERVLRAIYDSRGFAEAVPDEAIMQAMQWLGCEGICAEPASAASLAALKQAVERGLVRSDETVVCVITGSGLKQPYAIEKSVPDSPLQLHASYEELEKLLGKVWQ